ncbi:MAG: VCBS repeat-containing protein [Balneolaceae bacterium]|nr:VCBS repeat-containing protein [Balneolaceae bacterium]
MILLTYFLILFSMQQSILGETLFELLPPERTGIDFINYLEEKPGNNILESEFFYNGGGVAVGDITGNGFPDLYFTANQGKNALYLNRGNYRFQNITDEAGVGDSGGWSAGVAMVDINGNGLLDIYVCKAGKVDVEDRRNKLFIHNGVNPETGLPTFTERASEFGLDDPGYCTQPVFFDYNGNGLLDLFIVNYNTRAFRGFDIRTIRNEVDEFAGDKLYRNNDDGTFTDVSREAGIMQNPIGFGLSATVSDLTGNGLPDIYVANDFMERDYMYINQGDGTFRDEILSRTDVTSYFSMGSDIADINNNGLSDIFVADMLPPDYERRKVFKTPDYDNYDQHVAAGYHRKNMRNVLQLNNGDGVFTEVGQLAGVHKSDWSWATLLADFDNSGYKDIYITNGFPRFYTNLDYLNNILWREYPDEDLPDNPSILYRLVTQMEEVEMSNFAFQNRGDLTFADATEEWGLKRPSVSGGAAYVDLNNNGALDLVVNNINEPPFIYKNNAHLQNDFNYLKIRLRGSGANTYGIGSKVKLTTDDGSLFFQEAFTTRGFQSTIDPVLHFGLGNRDKVTVEVIWPDQTVQIIENVDVNRTLTLQQTDAGGDRVTSPEQPDPMFVLLDDSALGLDFTHERSFFRDRIFSPLMPHTLSNLGAVVTSADVNGDGLPDIFMGGGQGQSSALFLQQPDGTFFRATVPDFDRHADFEDTDALFFDATGNGIPDLYVVSGGNFDQMNGELYQDRLYINDGFGNFRHQADALPQMHSSGGTVIAIDIENNGSADLFVGGRVLTGQYPSSPRSYLLRNNNGRFDDVTAQFAPELMRPGLVTSAVWADVDGDGKPELIVAGEWMPIRIFKNRDDTFIEKTEEFGLKNSAGWWNVIEVADLNGNGLPDIIAGNRGLNTQLQTSADDPAILYLGDFNNNGLNDPLITKVTEGRRVPFPERDIFLQQLPSFRNQFPDYASWAAANVVDILSHARRTAQEFRVDTFESSIFVNNGNGTFSRKALPKRAQAAPIYDLFVGDFFANGLPDIMAAGNNFGTRPEIGPMADQGIMLKAKGDFEYDVVPPRITGFYGVGDVRSIELVPSPLGSLFLLGRYGEPVIPYLYRQPAE